MNPSGYIQLGQANPGASAYSGPGPAPFMPLSAHVQSESVLVPAGDPLVSVRLEDPSAQSVCSSIPGPLAEDSYTATIAPYVTRDTYTELMGLVLQASRPTVFELGLKAIAFLLMVGGMIFFFSLFGRDLSKDRVPTVIGAFSMMFSGMILYGVGRWLARGWREERVRRAVTDASNACVRLRLPLYWRVTKDPVGRWVRGNEVVGTIYAFTVEILLLAAVPQPRIQAADWAYAPGPGVHAAY